MSQAGSDFSHPAGDLVGIGIDGGLLLGGGRFEPEVGSDGIGTVEAGDLVATEAAKLPNQLPAAVEFRGRGTVVGIDSQFDDLVVALQAGGFPQPPWLHRVFPIVVGEVPVLAVPLLVLGRMIGSVLGVVETGGRSLSVMADGAAELGQGVRAGGGQVDIRTRVRGERVWKTAVLDPTGRVGIALGLRGERELGHVAGEHAVDAQVARAAAVEAGRLGHAQGDSLVGQPVLPDLVMRIESVDDRLFHQPPLDGLERVFGRDPISRVSGQGHGRFQVLDRLLGGDLLPGQLGDLRLGFLHVVVGRSQLSLGGVHDRLLFVERCQLVAGVGVHVTNGQVVVGPGHVAKCSQGLGGPQSCRGDLLPGGQLGLEFCELGLDAFQESVSLGDLGVQPLGFGVQGVLLVETDSGQPHVFDPVPFLLPGSPLVVVVVVEHPQRGQQQQDAVEGKDRMGLWQVAEETVGGGHGTSELDVEKVLGNVDQVFQVQCPAKNHLQRQGGHPQQQLREDHESQVAHPLVEGPQAGHREQRW